MEYQWNINQTENMLEMGSPPWGADGSGHRPRGGRGDCPDEPPCRVAGSGNSRDRYPAWGRGGAKRTQRAREEQGTSKRKTYLGAPWGGGRERQGRQRSDTAVGRVWALPTLPRGGPGDCPDEPPCRVAGSGNSRDRYPAWGRGGAKRTQRAREKYSYKTYISKIMIIGYCR